MEAQEKKKSVFPCLGINELLYFFFIWVLVKMNPLEKNNVSIKL